MRTPSASTSMPPVPRASQSVEWVERLRDGSILLIRSIRPDDTQREYRFLSRLSPEYRAYRFLGLIKTPNPIVARELTHLDPQRAAALVAIVEGPHGGVEVGVAQYCASADGTHCDCAVTVDPVWQRRGVGQLLMQHLIDLARAQGIRRMYAVDPVRCAGAHHLAERLGFRSRPDPEDPVVTTFELTLE